MSYRKEGLKAWSGPQQGLPQMPFYTEKVPVCAWNIVSAQQMVTGIIITVSNRQDLQPMGIWGDSSALGRKDPGGGHHGALGWVGCHQTGEPCDEG